MFYRVLNESDAQAFHTLRLQSLRECPFAFASSFEEESKRTEEEIERSFRSVYSSHNNFILGAFNDTNQLIGAAGFFQEYPMKTSHKGTIWGVYVIPQERGKGIARHLMNQILSIVKLLPNLEQVNISVTSSNIPARNLYLSLDFKLYGTEPRALKYNNQYVDDDLMVMYLK